MDVSRYAIKIYFLVQFENNLETNIDLEKTCRVVKFGKTESIWIHLANN